MLAGTITVKVKYKGEKEPRLVQVTGAYFEDEAAIKAHFDKHSPGSAFMGVVPESKHDDTVPYPPVPATVAGPITPAMPAAVPPQSAATIAEPTDHQ